jgi:hypothetical protein
VGGASSSVRHPTGDGPRFDRPKHDPGEGPSSRTELGERWCRFGGGRPVACYHDWLALSTTCLSVSFPRFTL